MSEKTNSRENKNIKALFSVVCLCIISLGLIVYFSQGKTNNSTVNENRTLKVSTTRQATTEVQHAVTVTETTAKPAEPESSTEKKTTEPQSMPKGKNNTPYKSFYKYPLTEAVDRGYSEELSLDETMGDWRAHPAVDFKGSKGDDVIAINDGIVLDAYNDNMLGGVVIIDHGGKLVVKYCGLESISVKKGKRVDIGNKIGTLGSVPQEAAQNAHLHLEAKLDGKYVNPLNVMGKTE